VAAPLITSASNPRLKQVRRLRRRRGVDAFLVEGYRPLRCALDARVAVREVFAAPKLYLAEGESALVRRAAARGARVLELGADAFRSIAGRARPDGLAAVVDRWPTGLGAVRLGPRPLVAVVDGVERPGNLGTIVRTASGAGADAVLVSGGATDVFHPDVVQGSVGTFFQICVAEAPADRAIAWLRRCGLQLVVASPEGATPYWAADYSGGVALVVGSERHGVSPAWLEAADEVVSIPMGGAADSLNVAVAAGIVLFEAARRRAMPSPRRPRA
jgi:RNA methyltransferase, TrmH family